MQDNQLHGNLTVDEAMNVASSLKLSQSVDKEVKEVGVSIYLVFRKYLSYQFDERLIDSRDIGHFGSTGAPSDIHP